MYAMAIKRFNHGEKVKIKQGWNRELVREVIGATGTILARWHKSKMYAVRVHYNNREADFYVDELEPVDPIKLKRCIQWK